MSSIQQSDFFFRRLTAGRNGRVVSCKGPPVESLAKPNADEIMLLYLFQFQMMMFLVQVAVQDDAPCPVTA